MASVALGVMLALSNLWLLERMVRVYLATGRGRWAGIALLKAVALLGATAALVKSGAVGLLPLTAGFAALPLGVVLSGVLPVRSLAGEPQ
jgi:hypothetical protein